MLAFENTTGDKVFDDTLPLALAIQLEQSPYLRILSTERIREILGLMQQPPSLINRAVGLEVCERAGAAALITGRCAHSVSATSSASRAPACASGEVIAPANRSRSRPRRGPRRRWGQAAARAPELGESRASMARKQHAGQRRRPRPSLDALRALRQGEAARDRGS